jgi:Ca2+/Na+ antiporter
MGLIIPFIFILFCCLFIWRACDGFERASDYIGRNLSEGVRGGTINAISSSIPELLTTLIALLVLNDMDGFAVGIGTTAGSALFNGMIIPAVCILAVIGVSINGVTRDSVDVSTKVILRDGLFLIFAEFILILTLNGTKLFYWHGLILMGTYAVYMFYMLSSMRLSGSKDEDDEDKDDNEVEDDDEVRGVLGSLFYWLSLGPLLDLESLFIREKQEQQIKDEKWNGWPLLLSSTAVIGGACFLLVKACEWLGTGSEAHPSYTFMGQEYAGLGLPPLFVAVIFASMATSVPDTIISVRDAKKGEADDAVANALGSNIFDICFALGFPLFLYTIIYDPIEMNSATVDASGELRICLLILTVVAFFIYFLGPRDSSTGVPRIRMGKNRAYLLLALYVAFIAYIIGRGADAEWAVPITNFLGDLFYRIPKILN